MSPVFSCLLISLLFLFVLDFNFYYLFIFCCLLLLRWLGSQVLYAHSQPLGVSFSTLKFEEGHFSSLGVCLLFWRFLYEAASLSLCNRKLSYWCWFVYCCSCPGSEYYIRSCSELFPPVLVLWETNSSYHIFPLVLVFAVLYFISS